MDPKLFSALMRDPLLAYSRTLWITTYYTWLVVEPEFGFEEESVLWKAWKVMAKAAAYRETPLRYAVRVHCRLVLGHNSEHQKVPSVYSQNLVRGYGKELSVMCCHQGLCFSALS